MEIANGFSELNDPLEQERRFRAQVEQGGDEMPSKSTGITYAPLAMGSPTAVKVLASIA